MQMAHYKLTIIIIIIKLTMDIIWVIKLMATIEIILFQF